MPSLETDGLAELTRPFAREGGGGGVSFKVNALDTGVV